MGKVYVKFPKAGLGNMMLTWSRAYVFSKLNNFEMCTSSWSAIHLGAWFRMERKKRLYLGYFKEDGLIKKINFFLLSLLSKKVIEPPVVRLQGEASKALFEFNKIFTDYDFFKEVRPYRDLVREGIFNTLAPSLKKRFDEYEKPIIGMHIRRGDFKLGSTLTPLSFFINVVKRIRKETGEDLPVTIFTDAAPEEIKELLEINGVKIAEDKPDILDILLLASSQYVVLSIGSTFSYWAAFLNEHTIIKHPKEWHVPFRIIDDNLLTKEIVWGDN